MGRHSGHAAPSGAGFGAVLRDRVFALLFAAEMQSLVGDQLARVALAVLVFDATGSPSATAATYAATLLPAVIGGFLLGRLGDMFSRRTVMVCCDLLRAACFAAMALPGTPLGVVIALLVVAVASGPLFSAAQVSLLSTRLSPQLFRTGNALRMIATQAAQVGGFVFGSVVVALLGPRPALLLDAVTFGLSAILVAAIARRQDRSSARTATGGPAAAAPGSASVSAAAPFAGVWHDPRLRSLMALVLLVSLFVVPEGLAVPYGDAVGASTSDIGLLLAACAAGGAIGAVVIVRVRVALAREVLAGAMAVSCGVPLLASAASPAWPVAAVCWLVSGFFAAYMVEAMTLIVQAIPDAHRARVIASLSALLLAAQGLTLIAFGALAQLMSVGVAIAVAGGAGSLLAAVFTLRLQRAVRAEPGLDSPAVEGRPAHGAALV